MSRVLCAFFFVLCLFFQVSGQVDDKKLLKAFENGRPVHTNLTVLGNVTAQAVLIPRVDARRIFGSEIANNYAVIEINVGNKTPDAALIIHGIFIDYSRWALSGNSFQGNAGVDGLAREVAEPFQASTVPNQIASEEYRVVRGQLLDAQMWSKRNWTMRILTFAGSLASAYSFSLSEDGIIRGLNAFSGVAVPGMKEAWPDGTIEQLNRISDFGYQANKVIAKQGAEVIVCFFPIDRFLTPGFKKLFLKSPALFFAPLQMLVDPKMKKEANSVLKGINEDLDVKDLAKLLPCYLQITKALRFGVKDGRITGSKINDQLKGCDADLGLESVTDNKEVFFKVTDADKFKKFSALDFISQMSLNNVSVTVDGVMTVETVNIPAQLNAVVFDKVENCEPDEPCFWTDPSLANGVRTGTIPGAYLTGGTVEIAEAADAEFGIQDVKTIAEGSSDQRLRFSFKLNKGVAPQTLHFTIAKPKLGSTSSPPERLVSLERLVPFGYTINAPTITSARREGNKIIVKGTGFYDVPPTNPLTVEVFGPDEKEVEAKPDTTSGEQLIRILTVAPAKPKDCYRVVVTVGAFPPAEGRACPKP